MRAALKKSAVVEAMTPRTKNRKTKAAMKATPVILASSSPRRNELFRQLGLDFKVLASDIPEVLREQLTAGEAAQINAYRKARVIAKKFPDALVIGADTLVHIGGTLFGKPKDLEDAYMMLEQLQGRTHEVVTAVCLMHLRNHRQRIFAETTYVTFRRLDAVKIRRYLTNVNPLDKAGAYAIQEQGDLIVERISGSYTNVVGLPLERLRMELHAWGHPMNPAYQAARDVPFQRSTGSQPRQFLP